MRVVEIVASIEDLSQGPSYSVPRLAESVAAAGAEVELHTVGKPGDEVRRSVAHSIFAQDLADAPLAGKLRLSSAHKQALAASDAGIFHTHGLWLAPNIYPAAIARRSGKAFVISPRGMLGAAALRFSARRKAVVWRLFQRRAMASAKFIHATGESELDEVRAMGLTNPVVVIPNGIDLPPLWEGQKPAVRTVLSLGRIHPKKGLDRLVRAWSRLGDGTAGWRLRIVGPGELGHDDELKALAAALGAGNVTVEGPLFAVDKQTAYREASLFVLPTLNENFAMTVAEALAHGVPVISTRGAPWGGLEPERCGWWVDNDEDGIMGGLSTALAKPEAELAAMGGRGRAWMERDFAWDAIGRRMLDAYRWAAGRGELTADIRL